MLDEPNAYIAWSPYPWHVGTAYMGHPSWQDKGSTCSLTVTPTELEFKLVLRIKAMIDNGFNITGRTIGLSESLSLIIDDLNHIILQRFCHRTSLSSCEMIGTLGPSGAMSTVQRGGVIAAKGALQSINSSNSCWKALDKSFFLGSNVACLLTRAILSWVR